MPLSDKDLNHILEHTETLWQRLAGKRIFVTGGTGFFGKWLLESFIHANKNLDLNARMLVLSRDPGAFNTEYPHLANKSVDFLKGDVRDFDFPDENYDYIIHAATDVSLVLESENPLIMLDVIVKGTRRVLDFALKCDAKRMLLTSSGAVYDRYLPRTAPIPENCSTAPNPLNTFSVYGQAKRIAEHLCLIYQKQYGLNTIVTRSFAVVGPYLNLDIHYAIGNFIRDGLAGKTIEVKGDGTPCRSYLYAADLAIWLWTMLLKGKPGRVYNVGSDQQINIADLAKKVSNCFEVPCGVNILKKADKGQAPQRYVPSIQRAREEMGLDCFIELDDAIKRTIDFYE